MTELKIRAKGCTAGDLMAMIVGAYQSEGGQMAATINLTGLRAGEVPAVRYTFRDGSWLEFTDLASDSLS